LEASVTALDMTDVGLDVYVQRLESGTPFALSRWGDGEWRALLAYAGENCDGHQYSGALRDALTRVLESRPTYELGLQPFAVRTLGTDIAAWLMRRGLHPQWVNADVFHVASIEGRLAPLLTALRERPTLLIGPGYLELRDLFPPAGHVVIPERNCFATYANTLLETRLMMDQWGGDLVVSVSAGMMANVLIDDLKKAYPTHTLIDMGSLWDPYVGIVTRKYHRAIVDRELPPCA
jgi:hypothetical protein